MEGWNEAPCPAIAGLKRDSPPAADSKYKEVIPFYCSSLANPVRLGRTTGNAVALAFSRIRKSGYGGGMLERHYLDRRRQRTGH
jgi:hypothetical protein